MAVALGRSYYWTFLFLPRRREDTKRSVHLLQNFAPSRLSGYTKGPVVWHAGHDVKLFKIYFRETLIFADENESKEVLLSLFDATFFYVRAVSPINKYDFMEMVNAQN